MIGHDQYAHLLGPLLPQAAGYARSKLKNRDLAQDAVQQAALRGLERLQSFDETRSFRSWWFAILHNHCIDLLRAARSTRYVSIDESALAAPGDEMADTADQLRLDAGLQQLSADHQEILHLKYFADLSYREIAEVLSIPLGTVMSRLHLARIALVTKIREEDQ